MIQLDKVSKQFGTGVYGLSEVSFLVDKGEFVFLIGPTGSGKTTIFRLLIRETLPTEGTILVNELNLTSLPGSKIPQLRKKVGVIFQDLKLMLDRTVFENVLLPLEITGEKKDQAVSKVEEILSMVNLSEHKEKFPVQLSGGELQRVAIARALVLSPEILLADEPTGNLDNEASWEIVKILSKINENGTTVIMATHNEDIIKSLKKRVVKLEKGKLIKDTKEGKKDKPKEQKEDKKEEKEEVLDKAEKGLKEEFQTEQKEEGKEKEKEKEE